MSLRLNELIEEYYRGCPGIIVINHREVHSSDFCMIFWEKIQSQIDRSINPDSEPELDLARDHIHIEADNDVVSIKRVDCGDKVLPSEPWLKLNLNDPSFFKELDLIVLGL